MIDGKNSKNTIFLFISLFLMLLSLFMVLVSQGEFKTQNVGSVIDSLQGAFKGQIYTNKETPFQEKRFQEVLQGLARKDFQTNELTPLMSGEYTLLDFKASDFFQDFKEDLSQKGLTFTNHMAGILIQDKNLEVTAVLGGDFLKDTKAGDATYKLAASRLEKFAQTLMINKAPRGSIGIAIDEEPASFFDSCFVADPNKYKETTTHETHP